MSGTIIPGYGAEELRRRFASSAVAECVPKRSCLEPEVNELAKIGLALLAENERLREALEAAAVPLSLLGKGSLDDRMNDALEIIRAALAAVPEERG